MPEKKSAGLLLFRGRGAETEVLLGHPGGPYWARKDDGVWTIPKGEPEPGEDLLTAARREFTEQMGVAVDGSFIELEPCRHAGGKWIYAWALRPDSDVAYLRSNEFSMEWPPHSGQWRHFPEIDKAAWFPVEIARRKILKAQCGFINQLLVRNP